MKIYVAMNEHGCVSWSYSPLAIDIQPDGAKVVVKETGVPPVMTSCVEGGIAMGIAHEALKPLEIACVDVNFSIEIQPFESKREVGWYAVEWSDSWRTVDREDRRAKYSCLHWNGCSFSDTEDRARSYKIYHDEDFKEILEVPLYFTRLR